MFFFVIVVLIYTNQPWQKGQWQLKRITLITSLKWTQFCLILVFRWHLTRTNCFEHPLRPCMLPSLHPGDSRSPGQDSACCDSTGTNNERWFGLKISQIQTGTSTLRIIIHGSPTLEPTAPGIRISRRKDMWRNISTTNTHVTSGLCTSVRSITQ